MNYFIHKLNSETDLNECAKIMSTSEPWVTLKRTFEKALLIFGDKYADIYVIKNEKELLGFAIIKTEGAFVPYIQSIGIKAEYRGKGIGTNLVHELEKIYFSKYPNIFMCVSSFNEQAKKLYAKLGYETAGELKDYIVKGYSEFILRKSISTISDFKIEEESTSPGEIVISSDKSRLDSDFIHKVLTNSYWSPGISKERVATAIKNSICFGVFKSGKQIGFCESAYGLCTFRLLAGCFYS